MKIFESTQVVPASANDDGPGRAFIRIFLFVVNKRGKVFGAGGSKLAVETGASDEKVDLPAQDGVSKRLLRVRKDDELIAELHFQPIDRVAQKRRFRIRKGDVRNTELDRRRRAERVGLDGKRNGRRIQIASGYVRRRGKR